MEDFPFRRELKYIKIPIRKDLFNEFIFWVIEWIPIETFKNKNLLFTGIENKVYYTEPSRNMSNCIKQLSFNDQAQLQQSSNSQFKVQDHLYNVSVKAEACSEPMN